MGHLKTSITWKCDRCGAVEVVERDSSLRKAPIETAEAFLPDGWVRPDIHQMLGTTFSGRVVAKEYGLSFCSDRCARDYQAAWDAAFEHAGSEITKKFEELLKSPMERMIEDIGDV